MRFPFCRLQIVSLLLVVASTALGDEGMWLFNNPPLKQFKEKYQFEPTAAVARAPAEIERALQLRRQRFVRLARTGS